MFNLRKTVTSVFAMACALGSWAQGECSIDVSIADITKGDVVPAAKYWAEA